MDQIDERCEHFHRINNTVSLSPFETWLTNIIY